MNFGAVWGVWGVAEFKLRLQADFKRNLTRHAPQAGVRRMSKGVQNDAKMDAKITIFSSFWSRADFSKIKILLKELSAF